MRISDWSSDVCSSDLPLDAYQATLNRVGVKRYADVLKQLHSSEQIIKIAGTIISKQERTSQKTGNRFAFVQCSDASGMFEVMLFSEILAQHRRSEEHTSELQSLMRISYAVFCFKKK